MCASYGLGGGPYPSDDDDAGRFDLSPLDEREPARRLAEWMRDQDHTAKITGARARNLNPLIIDLGDHRRLGLAWWWLHLGGKPAKFSAFNSRDDALTRRWSAGLHQRALAPATWYIEKGRRFGLTGDVFGIAAITTTTVHPDGATLLTYSLVTRAAVGPAADVHPRMPLIVPRDLHNDWLHPGVRGDDDLITKVVAASDTLSRSVEIAD